ncbi:ABC transporter ATP-binding protein [Helcococcus sueciensis]|uniref:ABC transporter ATP-binding protein n=1 Tax=Helcococcus sueciensis TaxID=241555 RepID=UPI0004091728|nr:ATP-binding cassette domain-containing protein [Helcococcus sueciensis]
MKLEIKNINKSFGDKQILHDISFTVESGKAMGFLGRNGAGKTTTIRTLMDVFKPDSGEFLLDGRPLNIEEVSIGYLPEERGMYQRIKILDQLVYFGELKGMDREKAKEKALEGLEKLDLSEYANKKLETLSKGNQQKVQILEAIINEPDIVVFDEPFSGLDPVNARVLKDILVEYINKDKIVIFSSHQMTVVEEFCNDITFIKDGRIKLSGNLDEEKAKRGKDKYLIHSESLDTLSKIQALPYVVNAEERKDEIFVELSDNKSSNEFLKDLLREDIQVDVFKPFRPSLEELFISMDKEA